MAGTTTRLVGDGKMGEQVVTRTTIRGRPADDGNEKSSYYLLLREAGCGQHAGVVHPAGTVQAGREELLLGFRGAPTAEVILRP